MRQNRIIFGELLKLFPITKFKQLVAKYKTDRYTKTFNSYQQFMALFYAQIQGLDSLREVETSLEANISKWYHTGFTGVKRSTLSESLKHRDYRIFEELYYAMLTQCKTNTPGHKFRFKNELFSIDSSIVDLCLSIFPWAKFRQRKGAIKIHTMLNHGGMLPEFIQITDGKKHDSKAVQMDGGIDSVLLPDSIITFDRAYIDYKWLHSLTQRGVFFVVRCKKDIVYNLTGQHKPIKNKHIIRDDKIELTGPQAHKNYPDKLRFVEFYDEKKDKHYEYISNIFHLSAKTIADIYKDRWQIELFFKWIKQNLKIKSFLGTSKNAVMTQVWVAMCTLLLLKYIKFQTNFSASVTVLARIIRATLLERKHLIDILKSRKIMRNRPEDEKWQLALF
jgi:hypothetical protein